jgi:L-ribulose-5-phosphate 3-epimerase UlaE
MTHNYSIGIMQGRLSCKTGKPLQSFPIGFWSEEFSRAKKLGFNQIEWVFDGISDEKNPISTVNGRKKIKALCKKHEIVVNSLCAHKFINGYLLNEHLAGKEKKVLSNLLLWAKDINIKYVILPIMDSMSIKKNNNAKEKFQKILSEVVKENSPIILLETDMPAIEVKSFINKVALKNVQVLYDLGNANAMGFKIEEELNILRDIIGEIHIKDRFSNEGKSMRLGNADTPIAIAAKTLSSLSWKGSIILETPVFDDWLLEAENNILYTQKKFNLLPT